jgi:mono/diheme cytochrome c family protein
MRPSIGNQEPTHMTRIRIAARLASCAALACAAQAAAQGQSVNHSFSIGFSFQERDGASLFQGICQGCHMPDGQGAVGAGAYPALAGNPRLTSKTYPAFMVVNGNRAMPPFGGMLDDEQIAAVVNYLRSHFGNHFGDSISPAEVKALRPAKPAADSE